MLDAEPDSEYDDGTLFIDYVWREGDMCTSIMWASDVDN